VPDAAIINAPGNQSENQAQTRQGRPLTKQRLCLPSLIRHQGVRYQFHVSLLPGRLAQGAKEHLDIIDAVISGDPVAAERITREHFASVVGCLHQLEDVAMPSILPAV
jgi:DNA-binding GntR family transcriptional regulator